MSPSDTMTRKIKLFVKIDAEIIGNTHGEGDLRDNAALYLDVIVDRARVATAAGLCNYGAPWYRLLGNVTVHTSDTLAVDAQDAGAITDLAALATFLDSME